MIISDLNHFEVVAEPTSIVGGNQTSALLASSMLQGISDQLNSPVHINNLTTSANPDGSATVGSFTAKLPTGGVLEGVISTSSATITQA